jgi:basic membrane protein A
MVLAVPLLVASAATSCSRSSPAQGGSSAEKTVVFVSTQKAGDNGPVDDMSAALKRVGTDLHVKTKYIEATDPSGFENTLRTLGNAKTDVVVTAFPGMQAPLKSVAPQFPKTHWILIFGDAYEPVISNVRTVTYDIYQGMYLSGVLAASVNSTGSLGYIGGIAEPALNANYHGFVAGARSVKPGVNVKGAFVGSFEDPAKGSAIASSMIASGVNVIQTDAAATSLGAIKAAQSSNALVVADSSGAIAAQYPNTVMGTSFLKFGDSLYAQAKDALGDNWSGEAVHSGLNDGIVGVTLSAPFLSGTSPVAAKVKELQATLDQVKSGIASGAIKVPFDTSGI